MTAMSRLGTLLAGLLVGLGVAIFARTVSEVGFGHLALGHVVGPGLVAAGLARIKLQRMLQDPRPPGEGGVDGDAP